MTALVAADVVITTIHARRIEGRKHNKISIAVGDGAKTYPAGGIPISKAAFGCPNNLESIVVYGFGGSGLVADYDYANQKLRLFQSGAHTHPLNLKNAAVADGATTRVNAGTNLLGANTGSDIVVAGGGANGGVQASTAANLGEVATGFALAATSLRAEIIGW